MKTLLQKTLIMFLAISLLSFGKTFAVTYTFIGPGTNWNTPSNWSGSIMPPPIINATDVVNINSNCIFVPTPPFMTSITNNGIINVNSTFETGAGTPSLLNAGSINISASGTIQNSDLATLSSGTITNYGMLTSSATNNIWSDGIINNYNVFTIDGLFSNSSVGTGMSGTGIVNNYSNVINNSFNFLNGGTFNNTTTAVFNNFETLNNDLGATFNNSGLLYNATSVLNYGTIINNLTGIINTENTYENYGTTTNNGIFNNTFDVINVGTFTNNAEFNNDFGAYLTNEGTFTNNNLLSNHSVVDGVASITNNGTLTGNDGLYTNIILGNGTINPLLTGGIAAALTIDATPLQDFSGDIINLSIYDNGVNNAIIVTNNASLDGATINVTFDPTYVPAIGDQFVLIDANAFTSLAATINKPTLPGGMIWTTTFLSGNLVLTINPVATPIILKSFNVQKQHNTSLLTWITASENNTSHFDIEYATDGIHFTKIGEVKASGNTSTENKYAFTHQMPKNGSNFYRINTVDIDATSQLSSIEMLTFDLKETVVVLDNASIQNQLKIQSSYNTPITIYDANGKIVMSSSVINGLTTLQTSHLAIGNYILKTNSATLRFSINR